ncbi:uncharacterized protein LOC105390281 isoform X2 [Plutella xylostella]|uniref:uncharacterized protein LOC105390281 isoform X2 n=1 Tax=Plutella xylostella TaxID=51655 RepID=UPI0020325B3D|nr:uncharacterized protein LOC105390281 isoform X2 [Plutella xylostella]
MSEPVLLYVYDLSRGLASLLSPAILGQQIDAVWHTAVVVFGKEYFFGAGGISSCKPGTTGLGSPLRIDTLGTTAVPRDLFLDYLRGLAVSSYAGNTYNLISHNCNNFSEEIAQFLCGAHIPAEILELPERALPPALRAALPALLDRLLPAQPNTEPNAARSSREDSPDYELLNDQIEEARACGQQLKAKRRTLAEKLARRQRRRDKKNPHLEVIMAEAEASAGPSAAKDVEPEERRPAFPPIVYKDIDALAEYDKLMSTLSGTTLSGEETEALEELRLYLQGEGSWVLGDHFLTTIGRVVDLGGDARTTALRVLSGAALRDDVSLLLHQDRRGHVLADLAYSLDRLPVEDQQAIATFMCNLFENVSSSEWLLYISEWESRHGPLSNIRVTTKVAVHALLSEDEQLKDVGTALMYNIALKEVKTVMFDDVAVELAMALVQFVGSATREEHLYRAWRALAALAARSRDVPRLLAVMQLAPDAFRGTSPRVDEQIDILMKVN